MGHIRAIPTQIPIVKAFTGAVVLALLGSLAIGVSGAAAGHNYPIPEGADDAYGRAVCIVEGAAGTAADPVNGLTTDTGDDLEAWDHGPTGPPRLMDTDSGPFSFSTAGAGVAGAVICAGEDIAGGTVGAFVRPDCEIDAGEASRVHESEYTNLIVGTGHAEGTGDIWCPSAGDLTPDDPDADDPVDLKSSFSIGFTAGASLIEGPLAITGCEGRVTLTSPVEPSPHGHGLEPAQDVDTCHGVGVVNITPTEEAPGDPWDPPGDDVSAFEVAAAFTATLSGDAGTNARADSPATNEENEDCNTESPCA